MTLIANNVFPRIKWLHLFILFFISSFWSGFEVIIHWLLYQKSSYAGSESEEDYKKNGVFMSAWH